MCREVGVGAVRVSGAAQRAGVNVQGGVGVGAVSDSGVQRAGKCARGWVRGRCGGDGRTGLRYVSGVPHTHRLTGGQADIGEGWFGCLYDESRRNKVLAKPDAATVTRALKPGGWNDYEIRCEGKRVRLAINGVPMVDYTETDPTVVQEGRIGLQVHGGGKTRIAYRDLWIEPLP